MNPRIRHLAVARMVPAIGAFLVAACIHRASTTSASPASAATAPATPDPAEREAVRRAVLDYVEGFYEGDSTKFVRSVRPEVFKYGFWRRRDSTSYQPEQMTWAEFNSFANRVKANKRFAPATAAKEVVVFDVLDMTASAKLNAYWGTDYLLLGKYDGRWMITEVLWQSPPPQR